MTLPAVYEKFLMNFVHVNQKKADIENMNKITADLADKIGIITTAIEQGYMER